MIAKRFSYSTALGHAVLGGIVLGLASCDALNPAFTSLVAPEASSVYATVPNAPGYVVLSLQDNVTVDGQLVNYLTQQGLALTPAEISALRARIRMRLRITHSDGTFLTVELVTGSEKFVEPSFDADSQPDLTGNSLINVVVPCDVTSIQLEPGTTIDVFIPVTLEIWEKVEVTVGNETDIVPTLRGSVPPQFTALQVDDVDGDGNVILQRNIDVRDVLSPINNVVCGSVVPVVMSGILTVPFFSESTTGNPGYDQDDVNTVAGIGGRYQFRITAQ